MLFNSYLFLLLFLPVTLTIYYLFGATRMRAAAVWLSLSSFVFYGWWNPQFVCLLAGSIVFNYLVSLAIFHFRDRPKRQNLAVMLGLAVDLGLLVHYKYFTALLGFLNDYGVGVGTVESVILPLGISFFTFTQIGYLLDCRAGIVTERSPLSYVLFVTFFPHLIAGPILHHKEMMPQFAQRENYRFRWENLSIGGTLFVIGLAKKVLLADSIAPYADDGFAAPGNLQFWAAWATSVSYALQLYFDFSGYSDMALGLAKMFGIRFPLNFNSPYKAGSIIEFWARWHMTLTRYLTAYLYYPVAMAVSRRRTARGQPVGAAGVATAGGFAGMIVLPTVYTMGLAGVWHGAGLQFLVFGLLHAAYLAVNHGWRIFVSGRPPAARPRPWLRPAGAVAGRHRAAGGRRLAPAGRPPSAGAAAGPAAGPHLPRPECTPDSRSVLASTGPRPGGAAGRAALAPEPGLARCDPAGPVCLPGQPAQGNPVPVFPILTDAPRLEHIDGHPRNRT